MKKLLSYVLWGNENRYWHNVPYLLIANSCIYPEFTTRFYIHKDAFQHPLAVFLKKARKKFDNIEVITVNSPVQGTQLTTLRMAPLWEETNDYLFCRDIDYALNSLERRCVNYFMEQNECTMHSIRSHINHFGTPFLAGLCGFNTNQILDVIKVAAPTFHSYLEWGFKYVPYCKTWRWGCEQFLLKDFFRHINLYGGILNCPQGNAPLESFTNLSCGKLCLSSEYDKKKLNCCSNEILSFLDMLWATPTTYVDGFPYSKTLLEKPFLGRAWTCTSENLKKLIDVVDNEMSRMVKKIFMDHFGGIIY